MAFPADFSAYVKAKKMQCASQMNCFLVLNLLYNLCKDIFVANDIFVHVEGYRNPSFLIDTNLLYHLTTYPTCVVKLTEGVVKKSQLFYLKNLDKRKENQHDHN